MLRRILGLAVVAAVAMSLAAFAADAPKGDYVGVNKCKMCHAKQYKGWLGTKHAKAYAMLKGADDKAVAKMATLLKADVKDHPETNEACVKCHVTGYKVGGYPAADTAKSAALEGVTCEACHGPGGKHVAAPMAQKKAIMAATMPKAADCQLCHTEAISPGFKFEETKVKVHPMAPAGK